MIERGIAYWSDLFLNDPTRAVSELLRPIDALEPGLKKAVFASVKAAPELLKYAENLNTEAGSLAGVPYMLKDLYEVQGECTGAGSSFLKELIEAPQASCPVYEALCEQGALYAGRTQLNEFAYGLSGRNAHFGDVPHPKDPTRLSGGSSSGSAWAVAKQIVPLAFGTDTAGSIRVPAAACGLWAMRLHPQHKWGKGVFPLAPNFDTPGWFTHNPLDLLTVNRALGLKDQAFEGKGLWIPNWMGAELPPEILDASQQLADRMGSETDPEMGNWLCQACKGTVQTYVVLQSIEAYGVHKQWLDVMRQRYSKAVWERLDRGRCWTPEETNKANEGMSVIATRFQDCFQSYDYIAFPVLPDVSPQVDNWDDAYRKQLLEMNTPVSVAGLPAMTLPVTLESGLSIGLQFIFPKGNEGKANVLLERLL